MPIAGVCVVHRYQLDRARDVARAVSSVRSRTSIIPWTAPVVARLVVSRVLDSVVELEISGETGRIDIDQKIGGSTPKAIEGPCP